MRYFTSDLHFFDEKIIDYCGRPFSSVEEMNRSLIENFKRKTNKGGEIYILGDILGANKSEIERDKFAFTLREMGIRDKKTPFHLILGNHDTLTKEDYSEMGFISVKKIDFIDIGGKNIMLTHDPCMVQRKNTIALCGHIHTLFDNLYNPFRETFTINVGVERREYAPISEEEILHIINGK